MTGEYQHSLDSKGRLFMPAKLRDELGEVFFITISMDRCLCVYSGESWRVLAERVSAMPFVKQRRMRPLFAHAARCELDAQGRVLIPQNLRDYAGFTKSVTIVGCNNHAERPIEIDPIRVDIQVLYTLVQQNGDMQTCLPFVFHRQNSSSSMTAAMFSGVVSCAKTALQASLSQSSAWLLQPTIVTLLVKPA